MMNGCVSINRPINPKSLIFVYQNFQMDTGWGKMVLYCGNLYFLRMIFQQSEVRVLSRKFTLLA